MSLDGYKDHPDANPECIVCKGGGLLDDGDNFGAMMVPCPCTGCATQDVVQKVRKGHPGADIYGGYRHFVCECGREWVEYSRDRYSPSGDECHKCGDWVLAIPAPQTIVEAYKRKGKIA